MPDWKKLVKQRFDASGVAFAHREDVIRELAAHLEEVYETALSQDVTGEAAVGLTLQEVDLQEANDWHVLTVKIRKAKSSGEHFMNYRAKTFWLPGLATLFAASLLLMLIERFGFQPRLVWIGRISITLYWPWLAGLPAVGAMGAYLSRRAQGRVTARLASGLSPALLMLITLSLILPWALVVDGFSFLRFVYFAFLLMNWVAIPGLALLLGALPFLGESSIAKGLPATS